MDASEQKQPVIVPLKAKPVKKLPAVFSVGNLETPGISTSISPTTEITAFKNDDTKENIGRVLDPRSHEECKKIMFLYNSKSGGQKAANLVRYLTAYTSLLHDMYALNSRPPALEKFSRHLLKYNQKLVICVVGGDGSQAWACSLIDRALEFVHSTHVK